MTEAEWVAETGPSTVSLSEFLQVKASGRKARLFAVACCYRAFELMDSLCKVAVEMAELVADDKANADELYEVSDQILSYLSIGRGMNAADFVSMAAVRVSSKDFVHTTAEAAREAVAEHKTKQNSVYLFEKGHEEKSQITVLRDIFVNPFRPVTFDASWRTPTVLALATGIYEERAFDRMPILADALQDAGCDNEDILNHCRHPGEHARGCWCVDLVLGKI
jgi:hypothetical protein